jgi:hypothetical protein
MRLFVGCLERDGGMLTLADSRHGYTPPLDPTYRQSPRRAPRPCKPPLRPRSPTLGHSSTVLPFPGHASADCTRTAWDRIREKMGQTPHRLMLRHRGVAKQRHLHPPWMQIQWVTLLRLATGLKSEHRLIHHREHPEGAFRVLSGANLVSGRLTRRDPPPRAPPGEPPRRPAGLPIRASSRRSAPGSPARAATAGTWPRE